MLPVIFPQSPINKLKLFPKDRKRVDKSVEKAKESISNTRRYEELRAQIEHKVRRSHPSPNAPMNTYIALNPISDERARELDSTSKENAKNQAKKHEIFVQDQIAKQLQDACSKEGIIIPKT